MAHTVTQHLMLGDGVEIHLLLLWDPFIFVMSCWREVQPSVNFGVNQSPLVTGHGSLDSVGRSVHKNTPTHLFTTPLHPTIEHKHLTPNGMCTRCALLVAWRQSPQNGLLPCDRVAAEHAHRQMRHIKTIQSAFAARISRTWLPDQTGRRHFANAPPRSQRCLLAVWHQMVAPGQVRWAHITADWPTFIGSPLKAQQQLHTRKGFCMVNPTGGAPKVVGLMQRALTIEHHLTTQQKPLFHRVMATMRQIAVTGFESNQIQTARAVAVEV